MTTRKESAPHEIRISFVLSAYTANKRKQERPNNGRGPRSKTVDAIIIALWRGTIIYRSKRRNYKSDGPCLRLQKASERQKGDNNSTVGPFQKVPRIQSIWNYDKVRHAKTTATNKEWPTNARSSVVLCCLRWWPVASMYSAMVRRVQVPIWYGGQHGPSTDWVRWLCFYSAPRIYNAIAQHPTRHHSTAASSQRAYIQTTNVKGRILSAPPCYQYRQGWTWRWNNKETVGTYLYNSTKWSRKKPMMKPYGMSWRLLMTESYHLADLQVPQTSIRILMTKKKRKKQSVIMMADGLRQRHPSRQ